MKTPNVIYFEIYLNFSASELVQKNKNTFDGSKQEMR